MQDQGEKPERGLNKKTPALLKFEIPYPRAGQVPWLQTLTSQITREAGLGARALLQRRFDRTGRLQGSAR
jgi:hypothetical protein